MKINHEILGVNFSSYSYPELQIWRPSAGSLYSKVESATVDMTPPFRSASYVYVVTPDSPMRFQAGDILGVWEGPTIVANTRGVDKIHQVTTGGYSYEASSPQNEFTSSDQQLAQISTPLVAVETGIQNTSGSLGMAVERVCVCVCELVHVLCSYKIMSLPLHLLSLHRSSRV